MTFFISVPVCLPGMSGNDSTGDDDDPAPFLDPSDELIAVIPFIREDQSISQIIRLQQRLCHADIIAVAAGEQETQGGVPSPSVTIWTFVVSPPRLRPVSSS